MVKVGLHLVSFFLSTLGYWEIIRKHSNFSMYFLPSLTIALQFFFLFLCGLTNLLPEGVWILYGFGYLALLSRIWEEGSLKFLIDYWDVGFVFFAISFVLLALYLRDKVFLHYDNFSHWALVVKNMLETNRYPNFNDIFITFQEYPLGTATYIYFFSKLISPAESIQMLAQGYIILTAVLPLFSFLHRHKACGVWVLLFTQNFFLKFNSPVNELLVDTVLPLVGICGILFAVLNCKKKADSKSIFLAAMYALFVVHIKNSGIYFAAIICGILLWKCRREQTVLRITSVSIVLLSVILWHRHCRYVFANSETSKHAFTLTNYRAIWGDKSSEEIIKISKAMLNFSITYKEFLFVVILFVLTGGVVFFFVRNERALFRKICLVSLTLYVTYMIGMLGMYLFSMPTSEALRLACNIRYARSILLVIVYLWSILALRIISSSSKDKVLPSTLLSVFFSFSICSVLIFSIGQIVYAQDWPGTNYPEERSWLESAQAEFQIPNGDSYCILIPESDGGYTYYLAKYLFNSNQVSQIIADGENTLDGIAENYIFLFDNENEFAQAWVAKNYPDQIGKKVIVR